MILLKEVISAGNPLDTSPGKPHVPQGASAMTGAAGLFRRSAELAENPGHGGTFCGEAVRRAQALTPPAEYRTGAEADAWARGVRDMLDAVRAIEEVRQGPAADIDPDYYVIQRDPARTGPVLEEIRLELERRLREGHMVNGASLEAEAAWLAANADHVDRRGLLEAAAGALETVTLWDFSRELEAGADAGQQPAGADARTGGTFSTIAVSGAKITVASGINDSGGIVGYYEETLNSTYYGFKDIGGTITTVGFSTNGTYAYGINDSGEIVGAYEDTSSRYHGFLDANGSITTINVTGATDTYAMGINDSGEIVGYYRNSSGMAQGFTDLDGTITTVSDPVSTSSTYVYGVSNAGDLVGIYADSTTLYGFEATPEAGSSTDSAPLPVTGGTLPGGMLLLGWIGRRLARRKRA